MTPIEPTGPGGGGTGAATGGTDPATITTPEQAAAAIARFRSDYGAVRAQIARVIVGHGGVIDSALTCLFTGGHLLLEGVPGLGKTLLVRTLASATSLTFSRVQFTPDLMPADITGTMVVAEREDPDGSRRREFIFQRGPVFAQIVLADEINRATPKTQSALLEAMQEGAATVGGTTYPLGRPFFVMATQNPIEQEGTYPLPEAQLDRFFFKVLVGYSGRAELAEILNRTTGGAPAAAEPALTAAEILLHQALVRRAAIAAHVQDYAVRLVLATHPPGPGGGRGEGLGTPLAGRYVRLGASPRAAQAIVLAGKCRAMLDGRAAASVEDVRWAALPALRHRLILNFEAEAEGITPDAIVENAVATVPVRADGV